jgi:muramoyltetrapeptide carboxypeptidase
MARVIKPARLQPGDTIAIIAPASKPHPRDLALGANRLKKAGYKVYVHPQCYLRHGYLAGEDKVRAQALMEVFASDEYKAVFCGRGGFGCYRLLKFIDFEIIKSNPKIFAGYSDITALLQAFNSVGLVTFHGPMVSIDLSEKNYKYNLDNLLKILSSDTAPGPLKSCSAIRKFSKFSSGKARGIITGGNLTLLQKLIGTEFMPSFKNKIVFLEDTSEDPYRIDGYLGHLFAATDIAKASGFIFGDWVNCKITKRLRPSLTLDQVLSDYFGKLKVPMLKNIAIGHGNYKLTIPIGVRGFVDADKRIIKIIEKAVG